MESQWVQNEWRRFQWLQKEDEKRNVKTERKLLCFIDNMTGYDLPKDLVPLQAIINEAGAYNKLDKVIDDVFRKNKPPVLPKIESLRQKMISWLAFRQFDLVKEEYIKVIREGTYSLDAQLCLFNICAEHKLTKVSFLETAPFDLSQEEAIQFILENSKDQKDLDMLEDLLNKNQQSNGKKQDYAEALTRYRKSAEQGSALGQYNLGNMYRYGHGVKQDYTEAAAWYRKSAEQGYASAQNDLGCMYENGYGVKQDYTEAAAWYRKSAEQGNATGQKNLGSMYRCGCGVKQDYTEAAAWYRKSAEQGNAIAQCNLGYMYENGYGIKKELTEAKN